MAKKDSAPSTPKQAGPEPFASLFAFELAVIRKGRRRDGPPQQGQSAQAKRLERYLQALEERLERPELSPEIASLPKGRRKRGLIRDELTTRQTRLDIARKRLARAAGPKVSVAEAAEELSDEPKVDSLPDDLVGLAFSGGGIRSATFNLGLLMALDRLNILRRVDYLSTVSGGGYIGAWWSAWLHRGRRNGKPDSLFPAPEHEPNLNKPEAPEVRHLREFSRFLAPRYGLFEAETTSALGHLGAIIPPSVVAFAALAIAALIVWLLLTYTLTKGPGWLSVVLGVALPSILYRAYSWASTGRRLSEYNNKHFRSLLMWGTLALLVVGFTWGGAVGARALWMKPSHVEPTDAVWNAFCHGLWEGHGEAGLAAVYAPKFYAEPDEISWIDPDAGVPYPKNAIDSAVLRRRDGWDPKTNTHYSPEYSLVPSWALSLYLPSIAWFVAFLALVLARTLRWRSVGHAKRRVMQSVTNRLFGRLLMTACFWALFAIIWQAGALVVLRNHNWSVAYLSAASTILFHLSQRVLSPRPGSERRGGITDLLRAYIPMVFASVALISLLVLLSSLTFWVVRQNLVIPLAGEYALYPLQLLLAACLAVLLLTLLWFDPSMVSLHSFYRSRLSRAFLGASNTTPMSLPWMSSKELFDIEKCAIGGAWPKGQRYLRLGEYLKVLRNAAPKWIDSRRSLRKAWREEAKHRAARIVRINRFTEEREDDDLKLSALSEQRPVHLVCCAANDLAGDRLRSLNRGARSAVLSAAGLSLAGRWYDETKTGWIYMSQAVTASGAAFNSNMGANSTGFGGAAAVLLSAFNLRLGLWVDLESRKDGTTGRPYSSFPGRRFFKEMFARTRAIECGNKEVHLSDGGHFENTGLYELVRRQCRFIIVSDCGADPDIVFEDLANAIQLVREDFSVSIDLDLSPLKPDANGLARQHMVAGRIRYPNSRPGILLVVKPSFVGDEPEDLQQYRSQNPSFPHETTGDQFYDEAQWESYRSLGELCGMSAFSFFGDRLNKIDSLTDAQLFQRVFAFWQPGPKQLLENFLPSTSRFTALLTRITSAGDAELLAEVFPEATHLKQVPAAPNVHPAAEAKRMGLLMDIGQFMEDTWFACLLDTHHHHAANAGWLDVFGRFASMPSFARWWPVLRGNYSPKFAEFLQDRFKNLKASRSRSTWSVERWDETQSCVPLDGTVKYKGGYSYRFRPADSGGRAFTVARIPEPRFVPSCAKEEKPSLTLSAKDIHVAAALNASGTTARFLRDFAIMRAREESGEAPLPDLCVTFKAQRVGPSGATEELYREVAQFLDRGIGNFYPDAPRAGVVDDMERTGTLIIDMEALRKARDGSNA